MATEINVSKLISTFGFEVDKVSLKKAEKIIDNFKKKLKNVEAKVSVKADTKAIKQTKEKAKKQAKILQDAHVKALDAKHAADAKSERRRRKLAKETNEGIIKDTKKVQDKFKFTGRATRVRAGGSIDDILGIGGRSRELGNMAAFYRNQERTEAERAAYRQKANADREFNRMHAQALRENAALDRQIAADKARDIRELGRLESEAHKENNRRIREKAKLQEKYLSDHARAIRENIKYDAKAAQAKARQFREHINNLNDQIRLTRGVNNLERIQLEYDRDQLIAQDKLNRGLMTQVEYEQRINTLIARRDALLERLDSRPDRRGMGGSGDRRVAEAAGLAGVLTGGRKFAQGMIPSLAAGGAAFGSVFAVQELFKGTAALDSFESAMVAVLGTSEKARQELDFFIGTADKLNAPLTGGIDAYKAYVAAMVGSGQSIEETRDAYEALAKFGRVVGINQEQMNGALRAFGQVASKGQLYREELQQQLSERLPGALSLVADGLEGVNGDTAKLNDMMQRGEVSASMFFAAITKSMNRIADPAINEAINNLTGTWQGFLNIFSKIIIELRKMGSSDIMKNIIKNLQEFAVGALPIVVLAITGLGKAIEFLTDIIGNRGVGFLAALTAVIFLLRSLYTVLGVRALVALTGAAFSAMGAGAAGAAGGIGILKAALMALTTPLRMLAIYAMPLLLLIDTLEGMMSDKVSWIEEKLGFRFSNLFGDENVDKPLTEREMLSAEKVRKVGEKALGMKEGENFMGMPDWLLAPIGSPEFNQGFKGAVGNIFNIEIDARGSTDPAATEEAVRRGMEGYKRELDNGMLSTEGGYN